MARRLLRQPTGEGTGLTVAEPEEREESGRTPHARGVAVGAEGQGAPRRLPARRAVAGGRVISGFVLHPGPGAGSAISASL